MENNVFLLAYMNRESNILQFWKTEENVTHLYDIHLHTDLKIKATSEDIIYRHLMNKHFYGKCRKNTEK